MRKILRLYEEEIGQCLKLKEAVQDFYVTLTQGTVREFQPRLDPHSLRFTFLNLKGQMTISKN